jgi:general secretion pathway protein D
LELVLDYLSESAGFIIDLQTEVKGKVDVWSSQPLTRDEAVEVLNSVLNRNGYAAIRTGRTLTIVTREDARKMNIPVISGGDPNDHPSTTKWSPRSSRSASSMPPS